MWQVWQRTLWTVISSPGGLVLGTKLVSEWLACWTQAQKAWVQIAVATLSGNSLRQTAHTHCASVHQAAKLVAALLRVAGVTAGLAESNGSLLSGLRFTSPAGWLPRTGISSGTLRSVMKYGLPLPFYIQSIYLWILSTFVCIADGLNLLEAQMGAGETMSNAELIGCDGNIGLVSPAVEVSLGLLEHWQFSQGNHGWKTWKCQQTDRMSWKSPSEILSG